MNGLGWALMTVGTLMFWASLIAVLVILVRTLGRRANAGAGSPPPSAPAPSTAENVLAERFARGEIDADEYEHRLRVLRGVSAPDAHS